MPNHAKVDHSIQYGEDAEVRVRDLEEYNDPCHANGDAGGYDGQED